MKQTLHLIQFSAVLLLLTACTKPDRNDEAAALSNEIVNDGLSNIGHAMERVDSAEHAGLFTAVLANTTRATIYENADQRRLAAYYAEEAIFAEAGKAVTTSTDSSLYCVHHAVYLQTAYTPMASMASPSRWPRKSLLFWATARVPRT